MPTSSRPGPMRKRTGTRDDSRPAGIAVISAPAVMMAEKAADMIRDDRTRSA